MLSKKSTSLINLIKEVLFILILGTVRLCLIADLKVRGNVVESQSDLLDSIKKVVKNDFRMENKYLERIRDLFVYNDQKNTERLSRK